MGVKTLTVRVVVDALSQHSSVTFDDIGHCSGDGGQDDSENESM